MKLLYHYSPLCHLPSILKTGLEPRPVCHPDPAFTGQSVCFTEQDDPRPIRCWGAMHQQSKMAVRYVIGMNERDPKLVAAEAWWRSNGVKDGDDWRIVDPFGQRRHWWNHDGIIEPDRFLVQFRATDSSYKNVTGRSLKDAAAAVAHLTAGWTLRRKTVSIGAMPPIEVIAAETDDPKARENAWIWNVCLPYRELAPYGVW